MHNDHLAPWQLAYWMNARKVSADELAKRVAVPVSSISSMLEGSAEAPLSSATIGDVARALAVPIERLTQTPRQRWILSSRGEIAATVRPIQRDGIHFYNYYNLPSPYGAVGPVILDILCPSNRLPMLNNGHLEPAITVNLGPGDIMGRWAEQVSPEGYAPLKANRSRATSFILGDSYFEPSWAPHSYALATTQPARILSYTSRSPFGHLSAELNEWCDSDATATIAHLTAEAAPAVALKRVMNTRAMPLALLAQRAQLPESRLAAFLAGDARAANCEELERVAGVLSCDPRLLAPIPIDGDRLGKVFQSVDDSKASIRRFGGHLFADMAASNQASDLSGHFILVDADDQNDSDDLIWFGDAHYLCTEGQITFSIDEGPTLQMSDGDAMWIGAGVKHRLSGSGGLIQMSNTAGLDLSTFYALGASAEPARILSNAYRRIEGWGYE